MKNDIDAIRALLKPHKDFPKTGILFQDIFPIFRNPSAIQSIVAHITHHIFASLPKINVIVGLDSRGFLLGPWIAATIGAAFVPVRKPGKLPGICHQATYMKEYGEDIFEIQSDAITPNQTVVILDDLIATGGSASAASKLVKMCGGTVVEYIFLCELTFLKGFETLDAPVYSLMKFDD